MATRCGDGFDTMAGCTKLSYAAVSPNRRNLSTQWLNETIGTKQVGMLILIRIRVCRGQGSFMGSQALMSFSNHIKDIEFIQITAGCEWDLLVCFRFRFGSLEGERIK
jgi:hypothetical protein